MLVRVKAVVYCEKEIPDSLVPAAKWNAISDIISEVNLAADNFNEGGSAEAFDHYTESVELMTEEF